jgi:hypothetical protein
VIPAAQSHDMQIAPTITFFRSAAFCALAYIGSELLCSTHCTTIANAGPDAVDWAIEILLFSAMFCAVAHPRPVKIQDMSPVLRVVAQCGVCGVARLGKGLALACVTRPSALGGNASHAVIVNRP